MTKIMECGHSANAINGDGKECCVICYPDPASMTYIDMPDLDDRIAKCSMCGKEKPSNGNLPFFEWVGTGSHRAEHMCKCGYYDVGHEKEGSVCKCKNFIAHGKYEFDRYYCGCRGWD